MNTIKLQGLVKLDIYNKKGKLIDSTGWLHNTLTTTSFAVLSGLAGATGTQVAFTYLALGTDDSAESAAHTTLQAEITDTGLERAAATVSRVTTTQTNDTLQLYKVWTSTGAKTIEEIGAFNDATTGVMLGRKLTTSKVVANGYTVTGTYKFKFSA